jgi:hypothetical protein
VNKTSYEMGFEDGFEEAFRAIVESEVEKMGIGPAADVLREKLLANLPEIMHEALQEAIRQRYDQALKETLSAKSPKALGLAD